MWVASGSEAASRKIMGTIVIMGMLSATVIAIFIISVSFYMIERLFNRGKKHADTPAAGGPATPELGAGD